MATAGFGATSRGQPLYHEKGKPVLGIEGDNPPMWTPAGTVRMSLRDWARWSLDQMRGERGRGRLMSAASYRNLHEPKLFPPGRKSSVAMDWGVSQNPFGRLLFHSGSNGGWYALIGLAPDVDNAVLVVANAAEDANGDKVANKALKVVLDSWSAIPPR
jgi:CubicO group peptidase (beta-lactamase class C family)